MLLRQLPVASELHRSAFLSDAICHSMPILLSRSVRERKKKNGDRFTIISKRTPHLNFGSQSQRVVLFYLLNFSPNIF